jgi:coenzyme F420 hydrogenase subunit beta
MSLDTEIARVVAADNCSGCGGCLLLDSGLTLELDANGFARPTRVGDSTAAPDAVARFRDACPGRTVRAQHAAGGERHPTMGSVLGAWEAWATDAEIRRAGSSGGTLTALAEWLAATGRVSRVTGAAPESTDARRTVSVTITTREQALAAASSRYGPVTGTPDSLGPDGAMVGVPCRVAAVRALTSDDDAPILLSFFCAGTPSQTATDALAHDLGAPGPAAAMRYRGDGWPGRFTVSKPDGTTASLSYEQSWGEHLGRAVQWRCKICPDGVGESADIVAADLWESDDRGYPSFVEREGVSALIARTPRGLELVREAIAAGVLTASPLDIGRLAAVQPLQVDRRETLLGRLIGTIVAGGTVPRYRGFGLLALALPRWRAVLRVGRGTYRRRRLA